MTYTSSKFAALMQPEGTSTSEASREPEVIIIDDNGELFDAFCGVCDCLEIAVKQMSSSDDLNAMLHRSRPMAVIAELEADGQDGCNVLMTVAAHDKDLPVLLHTGEDPALQGAVDAVESLWQLTSVTRWQRQLSVGAAVDFLFRAGRKAGCMRLLPT